MTKHGRTTLWIIALLALALVASQVTVLAGGDQVSRKDFALIGDVLSVNVPAGQVTVAPSSGFGYGGAASVVLQTTPATRFAPTGTSLETLVAGDEIRASGRLIAGQLVAEVIALAP